MKQRHQFLDRETGRLVDEKLYADGVIRFLYSTLRERAPIIFRAATGERISGLLGFINYDLYLGGKITGHRHFLKYCGIELGECLENPEELDTIKKIFQRKIRYWECRPMPDRSEAVVSPADARMLVGSLSATSHLFIKGKFFEYEELLSEGKKNWLEAFDGGDFAVFRLTPEKYHYNHTPVAGMVIDIYEIRGSHHSCNPNAVVEVVTPHSKNKRVVTVIDTDVPGGTCVGLVALIEVVALMIGGILQCYSEKRYENPETVRPGVFMKKGLPKSLYCPGSSTDILLFQKNRVAFMEDIIQNMKNPSAKSRFKTEFCQLIETDVKVRSLIGQAVSRSQS